MNYQIIQKIFVIVMVLCSATSYGQQDPIYTQYMFNGMVINPAYAGSHESISLSALSRIQWTDTGSGKPFTSTFSGHAPVQHNLAVGVSFVNDHIGVTDRNMLMGALAYKIPVGLGKLSFGLQAGLSTYKAGTLLAKDPNDPLNQQIDPTARPEFGAGVYYYTDKFFLGFSAPNLMNQQFGESDSESYIKLQKHYFAYSGYVFTFSESLKFRPNVLVKYVEGAPIQMDLNASFLFNETLWLGASYRSLDALSIIAEIQLKNPMIRIGYAYDFATTDLMKEQYGTHEIVLNYRFGINKNVILTPRYF
ncbi:MAG: type IX secretion system membrane protein PorP/SprF [Flammeovirgaceae bacterium]|nr:type IX secretion system membrane protein PorP/SprF [Flammeovirgaceae bacterium]